MASGRDAGVSVPLSHIGNWCWGRYPVWSPVFLIRLIYRSPTATDLRVAQEWAGQVSTSTCVCSAGVSVPALATVLRHRQRNSRAGCQRHSGVGASGKHKSLVTMQRTLRTLASSCKRFFCSVLPIKDTSWECSAGVEFASKLDACAVCRGAIAVAFAILLL